MARAKTSSQSARRRDGASDQRARPPRKPGGRTRTWHLFVSFWDLCLENLPLGLFSHRELTGKDAKRLIDKARAAHSLRGVSQDDLLAPYKKHEQGNHAKLCRVLTEHYEIALSLEDFVLHDGDEKGKAGYFINPLQFARIERPRFHRAFSSVARGRFVRCTTRFLRLSAFGLQPERRSDVWYDGLMPDEAEARNPERKLRAAARAGRVTVEVVALGDFKPSPYEFSSPEERLAAAVRLIEHHQALRGGFSIIPRSEWPGEVVIAGEECG